MEKEFVPYELALKLKVLGFDEPCFGYYDNQRKELDTISSEVCERLCKYDTHIKAPTFSQVFKFFRDNYRLSVLIHDCLDDYIGEIVEWTLTDDKIIHEVPNRIETYEETELACLEKLIEIVESKSE
jgi:hypothetical protein